MLEVTVLMSVCNGERYLREAIDSVLGQTLGAFEFLIIDDASTDASSKIIKQYADKDSRIRVITNESNLGLTASLNKGIAQTSTPYIARMDADDISLPERLEKQLAYMRAHPEVAALGCSIFDIDAEAKQMERIDPPSEHEQIYALSCSFGGGILHPTAFMRRAALVEIGGYRANLITAQDLDLWLRLGARHALANLPEVLLWRRKHAGSVSICRQSEQAMTHVLILQSAERRAKGLPDPLDGVECDISLLRSLLEPGALSAWVWFKFLVTRDIKDKELYIQESLNMILPFLSAPPRGIDMNYLWIKLRENFFLLGKELLEDSLDIKCSTMEMDTKVILLGYEINNLKRQLWFAREQLTELAKRELASGDDFENLKNRKIKSFYNLLGYTNNWLNNIFKNRNI